MKTVTLQDGLDWVKTLSDDDLVTFPQGNSQSRSCFWAGYGHQVLGVENPIIGSYIEDRDLGQVSGNLSVEAMKLADDFDCHFNYYDPQYWSGFKVTVRELKEALPQYFQE